MPGSEAAREAAPEATPLVEATDLLARRRTTGGFLFAQRGAGLLGTGEALRVEVPSGPDHVARAAEVAAAMLTGLAIPGAVVTGALPYAGDMAAALVVPAVTTLTKYRVREVRIGDARDVADTTAAALRGPVSGLEWRSQPSRVEYAQAVADATRMIASGGLSKVVLSRAITAEYAGPMPVDALLRRLRMANPDCHIFAVPDTAGGVFLGATPETLVRRHGDEVLSFPLAGTAARSADPATDRANADALQRSAKDRSEHDFVVEAITDVLGPLCRRLEVDAQPRLIATSAVWHLATMIRGTLRASAPSALGLAALLHPTPAVCGTPPGAAARVIERLEGGSRGLYSGLVGWVDDRGDGEWAVSLRCARIGQGQIRLDAGSGIVAASDPAAELAETDAKFRTMLEVLALGTGATGTAATEG